MSYRGRWASGLVCILMAMGASRASAGSISIEGDSSPEVESLPEVEPAPQQPVACQSGPATLIFHSQGTSLWGARPTWDKDVSAELPSSVLTSIEVVGGLDTLRQEDGQLSGKPLMGSTLHGEDSDGMPVDMVICGIDVTTDPGTIWHWIEAWNPQSQAWENPCLATYAVPNPRALLLANTWDSTGAHHPDDKKVTIACETGALAKCVTWGYRPWATGAQGIPLETAHQACTRMVRADYCGDGVSHTRTGTLIDYYDFVGVAPLDPAGGMPPWESFEAAWGPDGAACLSTIRDGESMDVLAQECPSRFKEFASGYYLQYNDMCRYYGVPWDLRGVDLRNRTSKFAY